MGGDGEWLSPAQPRGRVQPFFAEIPHKSHRNTCQPLPLPNTFLSLPAEFITTTDTPESAADTTKAKRVRGGRREATDLGDVATALHSAPKGLSPPRDFIYNRCSPFYPDPAPAADQSP